VETSADDIHFPVSGTDRPTKPVVVLEKLDLKLDLTQ